MFQEVDVEVEMIQTAETISVPAENHISVIPPFSLTSKSSTMEERQVKSSSPDPKTLPEEAVQGQ
jgi:hypothetical protein